VPSRPSSRTPSKKAYRKFHPGTQPAYNYPPYASTQKRCPTQALIIAPQTLSEITGPVFGWDDVKPGDSDLTRRTRASRSASASW
jgi:protocatechuate 3,4-dioxygenase beta subunit